MSDEQTIIKYIGNDDKYWAKVKKAFNSKYQHLNLNFIQMNVSDKIGPKYYFIKTYEEMPDIIYVDLASEPKRMLALLKLLCKNNVTRLKSTVSLHEYRAGRESLLSATLAGVRISHYKSDEIHDVVYDPISLLDVNKVVSSGRVLGKELDKIVYRQILRLGYVDDDHFRVETNSPLALDKVVEFDEHPLNHIMSCNRFLVESFSDTNLYYNQRMSYRLKYTYIDNDFFRSTEEDWHLYRKYKNDPIEYEKEIKKKFIFLVDEMKSRREMFKPVKENIKTWIQAQDEHIIPKRVKILVIDESMEMFKQLDGTPEHFPYSINFQTHCTKDFYQIKRTQPHLIIFHYDADHNNLTTLKELVKTVKSFKDYNPILLVFNVQQSSSEMRSIISYENTLTHLKSIDLEVVKTLAEKLDNKFKISDVAGKVFFKTTDPQSIMTLKREAKIVGITESVVYFKTRYEIPMWTTFVVDEPIKMLMTVVPLKEDSPMQGKEFVYRAILHGTGEREKANLRVLVNKSLQVDDES